MLPAFTATRIGSALLLSLAGLLACVPVRSTSGRDGALRAVLISDLNASYGSTHYPAEVARVIDHITDTWRPDLVLVAGDMVAGQSPQLTDASVRAMWHAFDSVVAAPLRAARIPVVVTLGNHDGSAYPAHMRDRRMATEYWRGHAASSERLSFADQEHYPLRYTVRYGDVLIVAWDATNQESARSGELLDWLEQALTNPLAAQARHRVVLGHLPLYAVAEGRDRPGEVLADGDVLRRKLEDWGATLFISGHHHAYFPGRRGALELLHAGALGEGPRQLLGTSSPAHKTVSVLDFLADSVAITTYVVSAESGGLDPLPVERMPAAICSTHGWVIRRDLVDADAAWRCTAR